MNLRWARPPSWGLWWQPCVKQQWKVSTPPPGGCVLLPGEKRTTDCSFAVACTDSSSCFAEQMITPTVEWTRPSSRGDCLYYSSTLTQTLSDSCKHFMHFRRWSSPSISLQVSAAPWFTPPYILLQMKVIFLCLLPLHFTEFTFCFHQVLRNVIVGGLTKGPLRSGSQAADHVTWSSSADGVCPFVTELQIFIVHFSRAFKQLLEILNPFLCINSYFRAWSVKKPD